MSPIFARVSIAESVVNVAFCGAILALIPHRMEMKGLMSEQEEKIGTVVFIAIGLFLGSAFTVATASLSGKTRICTRLGFATAMSVCSSYYLSTMCKVGVRELG